MPSIRLSRATHHGLHHLPAAAIWLTTISIAFVAAVTNFLMVWLDVKLVGWKFDTMQSVMTKSGLGMGVLVLLGWALLLSLVSTSLVCLIAPVCAGSGLPEAKGYLNGNTIPKMFELKNFFVRTLGIVTSTGAGFPAGREGPMVCIGSFIGYRVVDLLRQIPFLTRFFDLDVQSVDDEWFCDVRRIGSTLGGAAGVATAFNAPLGGILYMLEEATVTSWAPETTFRSLVCTGCAVMFSRALLNVSGADFNRLVIFEESETATGISWDWIDVPFFIILAAFVGSCAAGFTHVLIFVWKTRKKMDTRLQRFQPYTKMIGALLYAALCAIVMASIPMAFDCVADPVSDAAHRRLGGGASLVFVQYDCPAGEHNVLATLLLNPGEAAVKHLVSRSGPFLSCGALAACVAVYGILAMGMPGLAVPMGNFIPAMVIGSLFGRFLGEALGGVDGMRFGDANAVSHPGVYAMVGSAAMLGGFTHMTIAIVCLLTEAGHDIGLIPPLMLSIFVAHVFSHKLNHIGYDEKLILLKGVPYLELELPEVLEEPEARAKTTCKKLPKEAILSSTVSKAQAQGALDSGPDTSFPVVADDGTCLGVAPRSRLQVALLKTNDGDDIDLAGVLNKSPFRLLEDMPASRFYQLFATGVTSIACVVDKQGHFRGMMSRGSLLSVIQHGLNYQAPKAVEDTKEVASPTALQKSPTSLSEKDDDAWKNAESHSHHIPGWLVWVITFTIAMCVAITNYCMVWTDVQLVSFKFTTVQKVMTSSGVGVGFLTLLGIGAAFACVATCLVCFLAPICAGSGLPEIKGYLNGNPIPHMFDIRTFVVRVLGIVFSTAAGYPAGREGPMVCIGGWVGEKVTHSFVKPWVEKWVEMDSSSEHFSSAALLVDEEMFAEAKRIGAALGGAAGVAVAFNAPIGGILYMFEEVTVTSWAPELTFRALVIAAIGALTSRALLNATDADFHQLVIFEDSPSAGVSWGWIDVPFFILLAAIVGSCAAAFTRALVTVWKNRRKMHGKMARWQPYPKIIECLLYITLCCVCLSLIPMAFDCVAEGSSGGHGSAGATSAGHGSSGGRRLGGGSSLLWVQYDCPEGYHNPLASLLLNSGESTVKHLVTRADTLFKVGPLAVAFVVYTALAIGMPGLAVPMGNFIPAMVIGSLLGRIMGEALDGIDSLHGDVASPGVYAIVGASAMLGGFTHMSIAIVCLLTEAGHDITLISPLMLSIFVAHFFAQIGNHHGYDEVLILLKNVPLLEAEVPHVLEDDPDITTCQLCTTIPTEAILEPMSSPKALQQALDAIDSAVYPLVSKKCGNVVGLATACRLRMLAPSSSGKRVTSFHGYEDNDGAELLQGDFQTEGASEEDEEFHLGDLLKARASACSSQGASGGDTLDLKLVMDPIPFEIIEDMPASVAYTLFACGIINTAVVISKNGSLRGVLSRSNFMPDHIKSLDLGGQHAPAIEDDVENKGLRDAANTDDAQGLRGAANSDDAAEPSVSTPVLPKSPPAPKEEPEGQPAMIEMETTPEKPPVLEAEVATVSVPGSVEEAPAAAPEAEAATVSVPGSVEQEPASAPEDSGKVDAEVPAATKEESATPDAQQ